MTFKVRLVGDAIWRVFRGFTYLDQPHNGGRAQVRDMIDPGEGHAHNGVPLIEAEVGHWFTHHDIALDGQYHQRPKGDLP